MAVMHIEEIRLKARFDCHSDARVSGALITMFFCLC
jgi:hypothetical protein